MSRFKAGVLQARRIEAKRPVRRPDLRLADNVRRCVTSHSGKGHMLRLNVNDDGKSLECLFCEIPVLTGSDGVMEILMEQMKTCGMEFEVV